MEWESVYIVTFLFAIPLLFSGHVPELLSLPFATKDLIQTLEPIALNIKKTAGSVAVSLLCSFMRYMK